MKLIVDHMGYPGHHRQKNNWPALADDLRLIREGLPFLNGTQREHILGGTAEEIWNLRGDNNG